MPQLMFMPWCHLDKTYTIGNLVLEPFVRDGTKPEMDALAAANARSILRSYKNNSGHPVRNAVLLRFGNREFLAERSFDERMELIELAEIAAFAGLANREYFTQLGIYCNADCFHVYTQRIQDNPSFTAIESCRVDGKGLNGIAIAELCITQPSHVPRGTIRLDTELIRALQAHRTCTKNDEWNRWQNAITCFNHANTDGATPLFQVKCVLLCSAFEHILNARPKANDVAGKFRSATDKMRSVQICTSQRKREHWNEADQPLRQYWMHEFYRIRGDFAHGRLSTQQPRAWDLREHLFYGAIAFPLLVRCLLHSAGRYELSDQDAVQLWAFEEALDGNCFDQRHDSDSPNPFLWPILLEQARGEITAQRIQARIQEAGNSKKLDE